MKKFRLKFHLARRWLFRFLGGLHLSEHGEILHAELCIAELEAAELRLYKHNMGRRHTMLCRVIKDLLETK